MKTLFVILMFTQLPDTVQDGTIVAKEHSKRIVERVTASPITHVGIIFNYNDVPFVYEAAPPTVRKIELEKYYKELSEASKTNPDLTFWMAEPKISFTDIEIRSMKSYADSQIGRRYSIKGYTRKNPEFGLHCAQFVCDVLTRTRRFWAKNSAVVTPESLWGSIEEKFTKRKIELPK